ncbi:MAG: alpha-glucuronidase family glycosyl hydrolase [Actinomadura sp.]
MSGGLTRRGFVGGGAALVAAAWLADPLTGSAFAATSPEGLGAAGEDGYELWLRYRLVDDPDRLPDYRRAITHVVVPGTAAPLRSAAGELTHGLSRMLGRSVAEAPSPARHGAVIVGTPAAPLVAAHTDAAELRRLGPDGFRIQTRRVGRYKAIVVASESDRGALYGAFHLLRLIQTHRRVDVLDIRERPANRLRLANHWDNLDRSVERGFAGKSIFHWDDLPQVRQEYVDYARALASIGMNGTVVNNVNASAEFLSTEMIAKLTGLAGVFRQWGLTLYLSANFAGPIVLDGLPTADPLDTGVQAWWRSKADELYAAIPDFGGFLVKADSEGQPGPLTYGRTHADGANMMARAVRPHGGIVMWRAFIHDFDPKTWAHKSHETFQPLDGRFDDNVVLQIKNGPIDFQVREPVHPLFGALPRTNAMAELQITQEYTGQSTHLCYLVPMWKRFYDFDTHATGSGTTVADIVAGSAYGRPYGGVAGVVNIGSDRGWTGHQLAAANTHGYGRLAWNPALDPAEIAEEWVRMTFGSHPQVVSLLTSVLLRSWQTYEGYTSPLGVGFMIKGDHFTPSPQTNTPWHRADATGTGYDRTVATGNGYTGLYHPPVAEVLESLATCPDELLLFLHHVPYGHRLHSGKTVIQHIYDSHFDGLGDVGLMRRQWQRLGKRIDGRRHAAVLDRFDRQVEAATLWRDTIVGYYFRAGRVLDEHRSWAQVMSFEASSALLLGGWPNRLRLSAGNASPAAVTVTAGLEDPAGWVSGTDTIRLQPREFGEVAVPVTPPLTPQITTLRTAVDAAGLDILGATTNVIVAPAGRRCRLAVDAGSATSPVLPGYRKLAPDDAWDPERGYGWVGGAPQSRDRNALDALRRDFVNDSVPRILRVRIPAGSHDAYLLTGDVHDAWPTYVRSGGELLAQSEFLLGGDFAWLHLTLDGGADGHDVDLELSGDPGQHWHLVALTIPDPDSESPRVVVLDAAADPLMTGGTEHHVTVQVANTSTSDAVAVTARVAVPAGWTAHDATATIEPGAVADLAVTVVPGGDPALATLRATIAIDGQQVGDARDLDVIAVPAGDTLALALDAGTESSPLLPGYRRLSPASSWDPATGYGWVGTSAMSRDRALLDDLRRDFVNDAAARVLRIAVPAGEHTVHVLVGDANQPSAPTYLHSGGALLAQSGRLANGTFAWLDFTVDGGATGRTLDVDLTGDPAEHWHLNALLMR